MLDPQARALLDQITARGLPPTHSLHPTEARQVYRERRHFTQPLPNADVAVSELLAETAAGSSLPMRLYRPSAGPGPAPALVYLHGGGWVVGDLDTHDVLCRELAAQSGCVVVSVDYRLGPEAPFPAAIDDAVAALRWVREQAGALGLDPARLAIGGDSAGGNLAAAACLVLRDAGDLAGLRFQLLIYPATDMRATAPSHQSNGQGYLLTAETIAYYRGHYMPDPADYTDHRASPLLHPELGGLPPALVLTAGFDPLRDEGRAYADALSAAGTPAQMICFERQIHGFITMGKVLDEARTAVGLCALALRSALGRD
jgi:acetyl esterase